MARLNVAQRLKAGLGRIPPAGLAVLAIAVLAAAAVVAALAHRGHERVQHDNAFCLSCHEMEAPYDHFARSEHRELGCTDCHEPTVIDRIRLARLEPGEERDDIGRHAAVRNEACVDCHVEGDPDGWRAIGASVGHRTHLESEEPALQGAVCVACHASSIHQFTTARQTCASSGCHEDTRIVLGTMTDLTIHCVGCHEFARPASDTVRLAVGRTPMQPRREECASCHEMRGLLASFPEAEPHEAVCGACHDPHSQEQPRQAQRTCATAGCHEQPDTLTPMHRGLAIGVLQGCMTCHTAHEFRLEGSDCLACHQDVLRDDAARAAAPPPAPRTRLAALPAALGGWFGQARPQLRREVALDFTHARHRDVECTQCHSTQDTHGAVTVTSVRECRECHHPTATTAAAAAAAAPAACQSCHRPAEFMSTRHAVAQRFAPAAGPERTRRLPFVHQQHPGLECAQCHGPTLTRAVTVSCTGCHEQHHEPTRSCIGCHAAPPQTAHTAEAHLGCAGAGCHEAVPFAGVPRTRNLCLGCHQDLVTHEPQGNCADCHALPRPRAAGIPMPHAPALAARGSTDGGRP